MTTAGQGRDAVLEPSTETPVVPTPEDASAEPAATSESLSPGVSVRRGVIGPRLSAIALGIVVAAGALYGLLLHVWLLVHLPIWGDEAIVGVMAQSIDNGHFSAFYWGQHYGGLEPYVVAAALKIGGGGEPALNATPAVLAALAAVLVACIGLAAGRDRLTAAAAGTAVWVWPYVVVWQSVREGGFREATLCCGLAAILCCVRASRERAGPWTFLLLGVAIGLGWWASPEIVYFVPPCLVLLWGWVRSPSWRRSSLTLIVFGAIVGSVPWWYANAHTGFASLQRSALPANGGITYGTKLSVFFHDMLPLQLGLRTLVGGNWVGGTSLGITLYIVALVLIAAALVRSVVLFVRDSSQRVSLALALAVVCYPFLYAAAPGTGYWYDGRYGIYFPALVVMFFASTPLQPLWPFHRRERESPGGPTERTLLRRSHIVAAAGLACRGRPDCGRGPRRRRAGIGVLLLQLAQRRCPHGASAERDASPSHRGCVRRLLDGLRPRLLERRSSGREPLAAARCDALGLPRRHGGPLEGPGLALLRAGADGSRRGGVRQSATWTGSLHGTDVRGSLDATRHLVFGRTSRCARRRRAGAPGDHAVASGRRPPAAGTHHSATR